MEAKSYVNAMSKKVYITGDFNIDLLKINSHNYYNIFYENIISYSFPPKITRPTRLSDDANTYNILSNNAYGSHTSCIITTPISDHLMIFFILESHSILILSRTQVEKINQHSINNFINSLENSNLMTIIDTTLHADPNTILASEIFNSKSKRIPRNIKKKSINGSTIKVDDRQSFSSRK